VASAAKPFLALSIDGGGFRGLYTATLLKRLSILFAGKEIDLGSKFSLIAGTSTGGIIACALAANVPLTQIIDFYTQRGEAIFSRPKPASHPKPTSSFTLWKYLKIFIWGFFQIPIWIWAIRTPNCSQQELKKALQEIFKEKTLGEIYNDRKIALCVPTVNLANNRPLVFKTPHFPRINRDNNLSLVDTCLATSAAPIYFPAAKIKCPIQNSEAMFIDGGLWANNPILIALIEALEMAAPDQDITILSVGTAAPPSGNLTENPNLSAFDWGLGAEVITSTLNSQSVGTSFIADFLATHLSRQGKRKVEIIRLAELPRVKDYDTSISLDNGSPKAANILQKIASSDADYIRSCFHTPKQNLHNLDLIFKPLNNE